MANINWLEIRRKSTHIAFGLVCIILAAYDILKWWMLLILLIIGIIVSYTYFKRRWRIIDIFLEALDRPHHKEKIPGLGALSSCAGVMFALLIFEKNIALAAISIWTFGDSIAALIGLHFGKLRNPLNSKLTIEGSIAGMIAAVVAAAFFVPFYMALIAGVITMIFEATELKVYGYDIDDNIFLPLIAGTILFALTAI